MFNYKNNYNQNYPAEITSLDWTYFEVPYQSAARYQ